MLPYEEMAEYPVDVGGRGEGGRYMYIRREGKSEEVSEQGRD